MRFLPIFFLGTSLLISSASAAVEIVAEFVVSPKKKEATAAPTPVVVAGGPAAGGMPAPPKPISNEKSLKVTLRNASGKPESNLLVRYWIISRDMKTMRNALLDGGESNADFKPNAVAVITSDPVKESYTVRPVFLAAPKAAGAAAGAKPAAPVKPVESGGTKVVGFGVQVIKDGKVASEFFSEAAYKTLVGSEGNKPGPLFKAQKAEEAPQ